MVRCSNFPLPEGKGELLLALNAAEGLLQVLIAGRESAEETGSGEEAAFRLLCGQDWDAPARGAELLAPIIRDALFRLQREPSAVGRIALVRGPGSFTGLRLVLATGAGLTRTTGALQAGLDYLPLLAESTLPHLGPLTVTRQSQGQNATGRQGCRLWVLTHARRQLVHIQGFFAETPPPESAGAKLAQDSPPPRVRPFSDLIVCSPEEGADLILSGRGRAGEEEAAGPVLLLGSGLCRNRDFFQRALGREIETRALLFLPPSYNHPSHAALLRAASLADFARTDVTPLYARPSDAEDNIGRIACSLGLDPAEARQQLDELTGKTGNPSPAEE
jgi:tRNA A37 threonylcarbamoyladenosine modification protein TsaB